MTQKFRTTRTRIIAIAGAAVLALAALVAQFGSPAHANDNPAGATFFDDFDGFDRDRWGISHGWSNGDWHNCEWSKKAVAIEDGTLKLLFKPIKTEKRDYICGEIQSHQTYGYGTYEVRFKTEKGSGLNAAFFTYIGPQHKKPHDEIDFEVLTRDTSKVSVNTYVSGQPTNGKAVELPKRTDSGFITYAFTWDENGITWFVDGQEVHQTTPGNPLPTNPQKIYASLWGTEKFVDWMGVFEPPQGDVTFTIDWIAFTELGKECQFDASVLCVQN
ncbi:MAG: family 16 glycosylhydrolase [Sulfitobacter sp.]